MKSIKLNFLLVFVFTLGAISLQAQNSCLPKDCVPANCTPADCAKICQKVCQGDEANAEKIDFSLVSLVNEKSTTVKKVSCKPVCGRKSADASAEKTMQVNFVNEKASKAKSCQPSSCLKSSKSGV